MASQVGVEHLRISAEDLKARLDGGQPATVLDARGQKAWETSDRKLPGAIRVDQENFRIDPAWPKDRFTVVYSADLHDATSGMVAEQLVDAGFANAHVLHGGFQAWQAANGPTDGK